MFHEFIRLKNLMSNTTAITKKYENWEEKLMMYVHQKKWRRKKKFDANRCFSHVNF